MKIIVCFDDDHHPQFVLLIPVYPLAVHSFSSYPNPGHLIIDFPLIIGHQFHHQIIQSCHLLSYPPIPCHSIPGHLSFNHPIIQSSNHPIIQSSNPKSSNAQSSNPISVVPYNIFQSYIMDQLLSKRILSEIESNNDLKQSLHFVHHCELCYWDGSNNWTICFPPTPSSPLKCKILTWFKIL